MSAISQCIPNNQDSTLHLSSHPVWHLLPPSQQTAIKFEVVVSGDDCGCIGDGDGNGGNGDGDGGDGGNGGDDNDG